MMKAFSLHFSFEFFSALRNRTLLLMNYLLPLGFSGSLAAWWRPLTLILESK